MQGSVDPPLLEALAASFGELYPYPVAGSAATFLSNSGLAGEALLYVVQPSAGAPPWEYMVNEEVLDNLLQADETFLLLLTPGAEHFWCIPADEAAYLIEGRVPQVDARGERAWRYFLELQAERWRLRAESNPLETIDMTAFRDRPPGRR